MNFRPKSLRGSHRCIRTEDGSVLLGIERGAALLEFALIIPLLVLLCFWVGSLGFAIARLVWLSEASYAAVVAGAEDGSSSASTAENLLEDLFERRHGADSSITLVRREGVVRGVESTDSQGSGQQAPLVALSVELGSSPLFGVLPVLSLGLETVVARLTVGGGNQGGEDLSRPSDIPGACSSGWRLPCGACGTSCAGGGAGGSGPGGGQSGKGNQSGTVTRPAESPEDWLHPPIDAESPQDWWHPAIDSDFAVPLD
ncbi:MAG: hypothetical protein RL417_1704 [Pseudomonadota bacterium]|jgi:Flp pilus assembly protein TadG